MVNGHIMSHSIITKERIIIVRGGCWVLEVVALGSLCFRVLCPFGGFVLLGLWLGPLYTFCICRGALRC